MRRFLFVLAAFCILSSPLCLPDGGEAAHAEETQGIASEKEGAIRRSLFMASATEERVLRIGLVDCIAFALKNNSEVRIKRIEPLISEEEIRLAEAAFEPRLNFNFSSEHTKEQSSSTSLFSPATSTSHTTKVGAGIEGKLPLGTEYDLTFDNKKYKSNTPFQVINPYNKSETTMTITQPLLKGFGTFVNRANIVIAGNNLKISDYNLEEELIQAVTDTKKAYYQYVLNLERHKTAEVSLKRAQDLSDIIQKRYEKGLASSIDLLEAKVGLAEGQDRLLAAEKSLKAAEDSLKYVTNLVNDAELWNARIEILDELRFEPQEVDLFESLKQSFEHRPDYEAAKIELASQDIRVKMDDNELLPKVDLVGSFGLNGLNEEYFKTLENEAEGEYRDWSAGIKVTVPLGNRQARAEFEKAKLTKAKLLLSFERLQQKIILAVRDAARNVKVSQQKVATSLNAKETEEARYAAIEKRFAEGLVSAHDMIEYQEDLSGAQTNYIQSLIDYNEALITLDKEAGVALVKSDIKLEER